MKQSTKYIVSILIIDDEEELCILLTYALSKLGYEIDYSLTLKEGYAKLEALRPNIVLLDLHLPDGSGFSMIPRIQQMNTDFLVISAYDDERQKALEQGAVEFIKKPFDLQRITKAIADISTNG